MKKAKPIPQLSHPFEHIIVDAFEQEPQHSVITLLPYFGAMPEFEPASGIASYRAVIQDALVYMERQGRVKQRAGMYSLKGV
jgi:hypothetical protein